MKMKKILVVATVVASSVASAEWVTDMGPVGGLRSVAE